MKQEEFIVQLSPEEEELKNIIEPLLEGEGFELVRLKFKRVQGRALLGLYVDTKDKPNGIMMENLEFISRFLSDVLDAEDLEQRIFSTTYDLEVSSPGLDRPLTKRSHFENALSKRVKIRLKHADEKGSRTAIGVLLSVSEAGITVEPEGKKGDVRTIVFEDIIDAHMIFDFAKKTKKKN
jgi:ribosome maturation factor RimP